MNKIKIAPSIKSGSHHWLMQRFSAIALLPLILWLVLSLIEIVQDPQNYLCLFLTPSLRMLLYRTHESILHNHDPSSTPPTIQLRYTYSIHNNIFYLVDLGNYQVYSILSSSPYTLTPEYTITPPAATSLFIMSQINTYVTTNFT